MGGFQGLSQARGQQQGGQLEPQLPDNRQQGFAPASQNMAMLSGFQVCHILSSSVLPASCAYRGTPCNIGHQCCQSTVDLPTGIDSLSVLGS